MNTADVLSGKVSWHVEAADCLTFLAALPADSLDLVLFSPPYEKCRTYGIDFKLSGQAWVDWMVEVWRLCDRACKGLVACVCEGQTKNFRWSAAPALLMADLHRAGFKLRKPPAFHRIGIPGSGGPDWLRGDTEWIICTTKGKLPWSDPTAYGHPPKWALGGAMSNRHADGQRKNASASVRCKARMGRVIGGKFDSMTSRGANGECKIAGGRRVSRGHSNGDTETSDSYYPPALANPGNVIQCTQSEYEIIQFLREFRDATSANPGEVVRDLQAAIRAEKVPLWYLGAAEAIRSKALLLAAMHGGSVGNTSGRGKGEGEGEIRCSADGQDGEMQDLQNDERPGAASQGRRSNEQSKAECRGGLPSMPSNGAQGDEANKGVPDLWQEASFVGFVRGSLLPLQKAWRSAEEMLEQSLRSRCLGSDLIHCKVGGGLMGHRLSHLNEAPFPLSLAAFFVRSFAPPNGIVCDPFLGSGTTLHAAALWVRRFVGCDVRPEQVEIARRRVADVTPMLGEFG